MGVLFGSRVDIRSRFFRRTEVDATIARQRVEMILNTRRGTYWKRPDYGLLLEDYLNADLTPAAFARLAAQIKSAVAIDPLFAEAAVSTSVKSAEQRPEGLLMRFRTSIAFPGANPILLGVSTSSEGVTVVGE